MQLLMSLGYSTLQLPRSLVDLMPRSDQDDPDLRPSPLSEMMVYLDLLTCKLRLAPEFLISQD
jgi:hypothetical protein